MNQEIKKRWVEALRSGKYKQGQDYMRNAKGTRYCCLGVLTVVQGCDPHPGEVLPRHKYYAGLNGAQLNVLAAANDGSWCSANGQTMKRHSFSKIADYIERYL